MSKGKGPLSKIYNLTINSVDKFVPRFARPLWEADAGPKTIFFWAPMGKWLLAVAGAGDVFSRPAHVVSINQSGSLATANLILSRYAYVIIPRNWNLLAVSFMVFLQQSYLVVIAVKWRRDQRNASN